mmetsp:Transcript_4964/g.19903  ORF Transcript_4964/g.19903 Transcript_4964/m.19903 type:complete len:288 (+) Transcript_4964:313-1176(+)
MLHAVRDAVPVEIVRNARLEHAPPPRPRGSARPKLERRRRPAAAPRERLRDSSPVRERVFQVARFGHRERLGPRVRDPVHQLPVEGLGGVEKNAPVGNRARRDERVQRVIGSRQIAVRGEVIVPRNVQRGDAREVAILLRERVCFERASLKKTRHGPRGVIALGVGDERVAALFNRRARKAARRVRSARVAGVIQNRLRLRVRHAALQHARVRVGPRPERPARPARSARSAETPRGGLGVGVERERRLANGPLGKRFARAASVARRAPPEAVEPFSPPRQRHVEPAS